jgi:hypothetical protein
MRGFDAAPVEVVMQRFASLVLASLAVAPSFGCAENESSLYIEGVLAVEESGCVARPEPGATLRSFGVLDLALREDYTAVLLVGNQLSTQGDRNRLRTETARLVLTGAEVRIHDLADNLLDEYTVRANGFVDPAPSADSPGFGSVAVTIIQPESNIDVGDFIVKIRVFGETLGHQEIESSELQFPLTVCRGCLISFPLEALEIIDAETGAVGCVADENDQIAEGFCAAGQDEPVDCRLCGSNPFCLAPPEL